MIRVRIEAHPSVEPSKVVITVRAMGDGATLCASGMLILCARQAKQPRLRALFWTLFFLSFLQSLHFFWFVLVCFSAAVYCFICFVFYLIFQGQWNWGWFEASSEGKRAIFDWVKSSSIQLMVQLRSSGLLVVLPISGTWELGSSSYRSYTCAIITHQRHSNRNSKTLWCGVHYYYYYFPFTVSAHQVWIWLLGEDECFLLKYNPTSLSIFFPSTWCK